MLKQLSYALAAAALMGTTLASCSSDEPGLLNADGNVTFSVQLPADMATRADNTGTGLSATRLTAAVYQTVNNTTTCVDTKTATFANLTSQVEFQLVKGATYKIVFFADAQTNSPYSFDTNTGTMSVTYPNSYAETNDCFYKAIDVNINAGYTGEAVTLTRPVAQLNLGTDDLTQALAAGVYPNGVTVKSTVKNVANSLNMLTGEATGTVNAESTATMNDTYADLNFPYEPATYKYLAMGYYLLPGQVSGTTTSGTYDSEFQLMNGTTNVGQPIISSATPMQANYRTNIYGALLTKGVIYDVTIDPIFGGQWDNNKPRLVWNGTSVCPPQNQFDFTAHTVTLKTPEEFAWFRDQINAKQVVSVYGNEINPTFAGYQVNLECNIDLNNIDWTPIGFFPSINNGAQSPSFNGVSGDNIATYDKAASNPKWGKGVFAGEFNGNGCTIFNLKINQPTEKFQGLFAYVYGMEAPYNKFDFRSGYIHDLNISKADITGLADVGAILAEGFNQCKIENCTVTGSKLTGNVFVGGIVGYMYGNIVNCTSRDNSVSVIPAIPAGGTEYEDGDKGGLLAGYIGEGSNVYQGQYTGNTVDGGTVKGYRDCGGAVGCLQYKNNFSNNRVNGVTLTIANIPSGATYKGSTDASGNVDAGKQPGANFGQVVGRNLLGAALPSSNTYSNVTMPN